MNFTREPIIETVISSKEGCKLLLRNSKVSGQEEYSVDAVEVVSFGHSFFFRSLERSKPFLVPVSDYEIVEIKEMRVALKNANFEKAIKIGGGKESKPVKDLDRTVAVEGESAEVAASSHEGRSDKKKDKRRGRRRGRGGASLAPTQEEVLVAPVEGEVSSVEEEKPVFLGETTSESVIAPLPVFPKNRLIPPPPQLISDKMFKERKEQAALALEAEETAALLRVPSEENIVPEEREVSSKAEETADSTVHFGSLRDEGLHLERRSVAAKEEESSFTSLKGMLSSSFGKFW